MSGTSDVRAVAQVAQLATSTCATNFVLPIEAQFAQLALKIIYKASCAKCATNWQNEVSGTSGYR